MEKMLWEILRQYGLAGGLILVMGWVIWKLYRDKTKGDLALLNLHQFMHTESEKENSEKLQYLNQHIVAMTKTGEVLTALREDLKGIRQKMDDTYQEVHDLKEKLN